ncbi:unnamed protein product [Orchesella dallaii]|uniref:Uncharacterized protein n=1 Tax=Orchesella dallaii TaxID=48710 RepID=A0ABP1Q2P7_9HEXA
MHKIIQIQGGPESRSSGAANGHTAINSHHHHSHKRLASSGPSTRNGGFNGTISAGYNSEPESSNDEDSTDLSQLHHRSRNRNLKKKMEWWKVLATFLAFSIPIIFPTVHMLIFHHLWGNLKTPVDTRHCTCSCWDTIFKGPYETGVAGYKHVYFSSDGNTLKMWIITVIGVLFLYEAFKRLFSLMFNRKLRWTMGILFLSSLHSHYYAWWGHWNYWNDEFYQMWYHQVFFTITELISSVMVLSYLDSRQMVEPIPMLVICSIAVFHTFCSGWDQFVFTVIQGQGQLHQVLRDLTLMTTDIVHAMLSLYEIRVYASRKGVSFISVLLQRTHLTIVFIITCAMYIAVLLFP